MLKDVAPKPERGTTGKARRLRKAMTLPEMLMWQELRRRPNGLKFRRQHPSGPYIMDFYCGDARLAIEIDGSGHDLAVQQLHDAKRDAWFEAIGIRTIRIAACDVLRDMDAVVQAILTEAAARLPLHHPAAPGGPPPPD
nr:endonuclease domain-containing protein [Sphingobium sp. C100]